MNDSILDYSEELGDLAKPVDITLALSIYLQANAVEKVNRSYLCRLSVVDFKYVTGISSREFCYH